MPLTPEQRSLRSSIASEESWARTPDRAARTANARQAFNVDRFVSQARDLFGDLPDEELQERAGHLRKAHFARLAFKSSVARSRAKKLTADADEADAELRALRDGEASAA